jgi:hypothetical protein
MTRFIREVKYDSQTGDYYLEFPQELLNQMGWDFGDTLIWEDNKDGSYSITKKVDITAGDQKTDGETDGATEK